MRIGVAGFLLAMLMAVSLPAWSQKLDSPAKAVRANFTDVDRKILDMAKDWPADNYDYKLKPEMRTFRRGTGSYRVRKRICGKGCEG